MFVCFLFAFAILFKNVCVRLISLSFAHFKLSFSFHPHSFHSTCVWPPRMLNLNFYTTNSVLQESFSPLPLLSPNCCLNQCTTLRYRWVSFVCAGIMYFTLLCSMFSHYIFSLVIFSTAVHLVLSRAANAQSTVSIFFLTLFLDNLNLVNESC